jgi:hypothetical protein
MFSLVRDIERMNMSHLRDYLPTQPTGHTMVTPTACADIMTRSTKLVMVAKARIMAEDAL